MEKWSETFGVFKKNKNKRQYCSSSIRREDVILVAVALVLFCVRFPLLASWVG